MRRLWVFVAFVLAFAVAAPEAGAQKRRPAPKKPAAKTTRRAPEPKVALKTATPTVKCPSLIGMGVKTIRSFCDVPAGREPQQGVIVTVPPHSGPATLSFDLHARHTYSEEVMRSGRPYSHYRAIVGVLSATGDLIDRAGIDAEFRTPADVFDRIGGGAGPGGLKAVAPVGREQAFITIPQGVNEVSILGETLDALTPAGHETVVLPGRPVAVISNLLVEYKPAPPARRR